MSDLKKKDEFTFNVFGSNPAVYPPMAPPDAPPPDAAAPAASAAAPAAAAPPAAPVAAPPKPLDGPLGNPFDAPEAQAEIEKLALPVIQDLAIQQTQNARADFLTAIGKAKDAVKKVADAEQAKRELEWTVVVTIALMPAGPLAEAAGNAIAGPALQSKLMEQIANNAGRLEAKFGNVGRQAAEKGFDLVASDQVAKLAAKFDAAKAKGALDAGTGLLKGAAIKFGASSSKLECVTNYLDAMAKAANDSMHNLTDYIRTTAGYSQALAYYHMFEKPLQASYEAVLVQQAEDMWTEVAAAIVDEVGGGAAGAMHAIGVGKTDLIVKVKYDGRMLFAHIQRYMKPDAIGDTNDFVKWVTPDMEPVAAKLAKEELALNEFSNRVPDPKREPGERVVLADGWGRERVLVVQVEDQGIFWKDYGVLTFKKWPATPEEENALRSRAAIQNGGLEKIDLKSVKGLKPPA